MPEKGITLRGQQRDHITSPYPRYMGVWGFQRPHSWNLASEFYAAAPALAVAHARARAHSGRKLSVSVKAGAWRIINRVDDFRATVIITWVKSLGNGTAAELCNKVIKSALKSASRQHHFFLSLFSPNCFVHDWTRQGERHHCRRTARVWRPFCLQRWPVAAAWRR